MGETGETGEKGRRDRGQRETEESVGAKKKKDGQGRGEISPACPSPMPGREHSERQRLRRSPAVRAAEKRRRGNKAKMRSTKRRPTSILFGTTMKKMPPARCTSTPTMASARRATNIVGDGRRGEGEREREREKGRERERTKERERERWQWRRPSQRGGRSRGRGSTFWQQQRRTGGADVVAGGTTGERERKRKSGERTGEKKEGETRGHG